MPFFGASRPRVFAHRGGAALGPENTIAAFELSERVSQPERDRRGLPAPATGLTSIP